MSHGENSESGKNDDGDPVNDIRAGAHQAIVFDETLRRPHLTYYSVQDGRAVEDDDIDLGPVETVARTTELARLMMRFAKLNDLRDGTDALRSGEEESLDDLAGQLTPERVLFCLAALHGVDLSRLPDETAAKLRALQGMVPDGDAKAVLSIFGAARQDCRWPGAVVPYELRGVPVGQMTSALDRWEGKTPVVFRRKTAGDQNWLRIVQSAHTSSSHVGMQKTGAQVIKITTNCDGGRLAHELAHAVGLHHEQRRPDRDRYVEVLIDNIDPPHLKNFLIAKRSLTYNIPYDPGSITHYSLKAFPKKKRVGMRTMRLLIEYKGTVGQRRKLSRGDIATIEAMHAGAST